MKTLSNVNVDAAALSNAVANLKNAITSIESTKVMLKQKYQQLGNSWNDRKYIELGNIVHICLSALNNIEKNLLKGEKYVVQLIKIVQEYNNINFSAHNSNTTNNVVNQILQVPSNNAMKQTSHRPLIGSRDGQIDSVISDVKNGSNINISRETAEKMLDSLHDYSGPYYSEIRYAYNNPSAPQSLQDAMNYVDAYINSAPKWSGTVFRGINVSRSVAENILNSETIDMLGPSSWSTSETIAQHFSDGDNPVRMVFMLSDNQSGASITHLATYNGSEEEVLAPSSVQYIADSVNEVSINGREYIYVYVHEQRR